MKDHTPRLQLPRGLAPLGYRDFGIYWLGLAVTTTGRWVELTGVVWVLYELTHSPFLVGLLGLCRALPLLLLTPIAGVVADRIDQRLLLFISQSLAIVASLTLAILIYTGRLEVWHVYTQVLVQSSITAFDSTIRQALFPRLVPRAVLGKAVALTITATRVSKFLGPTLGGFLIAGLGTASPFFVNAASFLGLLGAVALMRPLAPTARTGAAASFRGEFMEGVRYILSRPLLKGLITLELIFGIFEINPIMIAIIGREILNVGPEKLGLLLGAPALGSGAAIIWALVATRSEHSPRFNLIGSMVYAAVLVLLALSPNYAFSFVALAGLGVLEFLMTITRSSIMQMVAPEHMRGRVLANVGMVTRASGPLGETQGGAMSSLIGPNAAIVIAATAIAGVAGAIARFNPTLWNFSTKP